MVNNRETKTPMSSKYKGNTTQPAADFARYSLRSIGSPAPIDCYCLSVDIRRSIRGQKQRNLRYLFRFPLRFIRPMPLDILPWLHVNILHILSGTDLRRNGARAYGRAPSLSFLACTSKTSTASLADNSAIARPIPELAPVKLPPY